jgi:hypothetical protein
MDVLNDEQRLMYRLIFEESDKNEYEIDLFQYIDNISEVDTFSNRILHNLTECDIVVEEQVFLLLSDKKAWVIKIKK